MQDLSSIPTSQPKQDFWDQNNKLKPLLLVLIFVFLISGIFLVALTVWQSNYRQKVYEETKANLPVHKESVSAGQPMSESGQKIYRNEKYGYEFEYPSSAQENDGNIYLGGDANVLIQVQKKNSDYKSFGAPVTINGLQFWEDRGRGTSNFYFINDYINRTDFTLHIQFSAPDELPYVPVFEQMMKTFKFTK